MIQNLTLNKKKTYTLYEFLNRNKSVKNINPKKNITVTCNKKPNKYFETLEKVRKLIEDANKITWLKNRWISVMTNLNAYNKNKDTYTLNDLVVTNYGIKGELIIADGLSYSDILSNIPTIQDNLKCRVIITRKDVNSSIHIEFIFSPQSNLNFLPIEVKPNEIYLGNDFKGEPIIVDISKYPHVLCSGGTRSGKSKLLDVVITTLINSNSKDEVGFFLNQIAKGDLTIYRRAEHIIGYAKTLEDVEANLNYIVNTIMQERSELIEPLHEDGKIDNYLDYNELIKDVNKKLSTIYVVFDEASSLFEDTKYNDSKEKAIRMRIIKHIRSIVQYGASLGVYSIISLQRPTADNLPSFVKSQSTINVSFNQNNSKSSEVAVDDPLLAVGLKKRHFVYKLGDDIKFGIVPFITSTNVIKDIRRFFRNTPKSLTFKESDIKEKDIKEEFDEKETEKLNEDVFNGKIKFK